MLALGMTCCWVRHDGDRLVGHLGSTRAAIVVEPDAVAADCFNTRRAILLKHSVRRLANAGRHVDLDAGYARWRSTGEMAYRLLRAGIQYAQGFSVNVANRQTTRQSYRLVGSSRTSSAGASSISTPRATASALLRMSRTGTTSRAPATPGTGPGPHGQDGHAGAGRAALEQAPRRVGQHRRGRDHLSLLSDSSTTLDGQQPVRAGRGPAACGGRRRFANWTRTRSPQAGALDEARNAMIRVSLLP
jgi:Glycosyl hydrolases family 6